MRKNLLEQHRKIEDRGPCRIQGMALQHHHQSFPREDLLQDHLRRRLSVPYHHHQSLPREDLLQDHLRRRLLVLQHHHQSPHPQ